MTGFDENYLWAAILIGILIICSITSRREFFEAPFIPSQPWIEYPQFPSPYRGDQLYLGGSTKCFSCEKDMIKRGLPTYLSHPTKCFDCDSQLANSYGAWAGHYGQSNKCYSCESQYAPNPLKLNKRCGRCGRVDGRSYDDDTATATDATGGVGLIN